jgi:hypothetical protein
MFSNSRDRNEEEENKMNIKDVEEIVFSKTGDMLRDIFFRQTELENEYSKIEGRDFKVNIDTKEGQVVLKDFAWRITEELGEAMNCLKNKPWKQTQIRTDYLHYVEELMDAFHFMVSLFILSGLTCTDVYELYFKKSEVNKFRQRSKY